MNFFTFLGELFLKEITNVLGLSKLMKLTPGNLLKLFYQNPKAFIEKIGQMSTESRKEFANAIKKAQTELLSQPLAVKKAVEAQLKGLQEASKLLERQTGKKQPVPTQEQVKAQVEASAKQGADFSFLSSS